MNADFVTLTQEAVTAQMYVEDSVTVRSARLESWRDPMLQGMLYSLRSHVAQRRQWEESTTICTKLSWRDRLRVLFGGEIATTLQVNVYHNCPHIQADPTSDHIDFLEHRAKT